jgi:hypothetical protein
MLSAGILITEAVRLDGNERASFRFADLAPAFEPFFVFVLDIPHYSNRSACPTTYAVRLGHFPGEALPQLH